MKMLVPNFLVIAISTLALSSLPIAIAKAIKPVQCSVKSSSSICAKTEYCLAAKPHSYCAKKLDGDKVCTKDEACKSNICFTAKTKKGKRVCAPAPPTGYSLKARCTLSKQCQSSFCDDGYCAKPVAAGQKCPKNAGCTEFSKGAKCLSEPTTFIVYNDAGSKQTKSLSAGKCSYISNLGDGMKCTSDASCYEAKFFCNSSSKCEAKRPYAQQCVKDDQCVDAFCVPPRLHQRGAFPVSEICGCISDSVCPSGSFCNPKVHLCSSALSYQSPCTADRQCSSGECSAGKCGCASGSQDCGGEAYCNASTLTCDTKLAYGETCSSNESCSTGICIDPPSSDICGCQDDTSCGPTSYCNTQSNLCDARQSVGEGCTTNASCASSLCGPNSGLCLCATDSDCGGDGQFRCSNAGECKLGEGQPCSSSTQCVSQLCIAGYYGSGTCT